uniref:Uncharacterized protein n=1 Tax=Arundo donax TaxID=35708 RepID=A0A0A8Y6J5_ARUDO
MPHGRSHYSPLCSLNYYIQSNPQLSLCIDSMVCR